MDEIRVLMRPRQRMPLLSGVMVIVAAGLLFGQEKPKPKKPEAPPTKLTLPADSTKADSLRRSRQRKADERLQLPDVLIYGSDTQKRIAGKKITISPDQPELVNPPTLYDPLRGEALETGQRSKTPRPEVNTKLHQFEIGAYGGRYGRYGGHGKWWQALEQFDYGIEASASHLDGQFENSSEDAVAVGLKLGLAPVPGSRWQIYATYRRDAYGLYGAAIRDQTRKLATTLAQLTIDQRLTASLQASLSAEIHTLGLTDTGLQEHENTLYSANLRLEQRFDKGAGFLSLRTVGDDLDAPARTAGRIRWHALEAGGQVTLGRRLNAEIAAQLTAIALPGATTQSLAGPRLRLTYTPSSRLVLAVNAGSGYTYLPWAHALDANRYLAGTSRALPEKVKWRVVATIDWQATNTFVLLARYENSRIDGFQYLVRDSLGTFLFETGDFQLGMAAVGGRLALSSRTKLEFSLNLFSDALVEAGGATNTLFDVPYRGEFRAPVRIEFKPDSRVTLEGHVAWIGSRRTALRPVPVPGSERMAFAELPAYIFAGFAATYHPGEQVEFYLFGENLLDEKYEIWEGYRGIGLSGRLGVRVRW